MNMNKKTFITILLAFVAMAGYGQTFTPAREDSIDFVITGETTIKADSVLWWSCAPFMLNAVDWKVPVDGGRFRIEARLPRHTFIQIGDYEDHDLHFIVEETPTHINLVTGEVNGSDVQRRFVQIQMREREIEHQLGTDAIYACVEEEMPIFFLQLERRV